ncbi:cupin domain-containing protein [Treponema parvum]|uniref:Cupin domain-containing protein n=1 Tax=Treponema parvum TaxID=138851 RepID=A0A975F2Y9_9SPIR|nr:cupin domain-containing protein [Treponema parvum]QTQ13149.1 cupin domain-containing protein [Treponema parvum]
MEIKNFEDIPFMEFPTGRRTHVMIGQNGAIKGQKFCQGFVEIFPGGSIPEHNHKTVESYTILEGEGEITVDGVTLPIKKGQYVFMEAWQKHSLVNTGKEKMIMMFVYAPQIVVDHWDKEIRS